jgi:hypothetical protein
MSSPSESPTVALPDYYGLIVNGLFNWLSYVGRGRFKGIVIVG